jgi:DNA-binding GntR family transcriptional regulator
MVVNTTAAGDAAPTKSHKLEIAYLAIRQRIISGAFPSGYTLIVNSLAKELNLSAMPVREALRRLETEGWVTSTVNKSAQVASFSDQQWLDLMQVLAVLDGYAVALAAPHITPGDLAELRRVNEAIKEAIAVPDFLAISNGNEAFHALLYERCPNSKLREDLHAHQERLNFMRKPAFTHFLSQSMSAARQHDELIGLLESSASPAEIEQLAREHKLRAIAVYEQERGGH